MKKMVKWLIALSMVLIVFPRTALGQEDIVEEQIEIEADGYAIPAIITKPAGDTDDLPVVVMLHGTASDKDEAGLGYIDMARVFAENGIASIRFDFAGSGDSARDYIEYTITGAVEDAEAVIDYIRSQDDVFDDDNIGVLGWSQGGLIALLTAANEDNDIEAVVTWAGTYDMGFTITEEEIAQAEAEGFYIREYDWREDTQVSQQWVEEALNIDVLDEFKRYDGPILALHGSEDTVVPIEFATEIVDVNTDDDSVVYIVEGADHTFNIFTDDHSLFEETMQETVKFLMEHLD